jgi:hypothetical protein
LGNTLVTNIRHFLDECGAIPEDIPSPALNLALYLGSIIAWVTDHLPDNKLQTNVPCRKKPGRIIRCLGEIEAKLRADFVIEWYCPFCGDNGFISGWQGTLWDRQHPLSFNNRYGSQNRA